jgi:hypothetical protein
LCRTKQFTRKVHEWGFKKNIKRKGRTDIFKDLGSVEEDIVIDLMGRKRKRQKLMCGKRESESEGLDYSLHAASTVASAVVAGKRRL